MYIILNEWNDEFSAKCDTMEQVGEILEEQMEETGNPVEDYQVFEIARQVQLERKVSYVEKMDEPNPPSDDNVVPFRTLGDILKSTGIAEYDFGREVWEPRY